jgi:hypothetical protein
MDEPVTLSMEQAERKTSAAAEARARIERVIGIRAIRNKVNNCIFRLLIRQA